ncbi:alpha-(1,3)-fucosyltransferase 7-like [Ruditapes philippinarum]|uniref:alpha-(1,3)-fucosyltransferase 7-like n=1 Tax=Ruditapes philippinarum TaxID=129788 RepID=UPI00295C1CB5|nr:alpha-(1,3)-fucosyltransferase 7-like [Ruditapes philippinarum]
MYVGKMLTFCTFLWRIAFLVAVMTYIVMFYRGMGFWTMRHDVTFENLTSQHHLNRSKENYLILYYNVPAFISRYRKYAMSCDFKKCPWNNCELTFDKKYARKGDAVIYDGIFIPKKLEFIRPIGQVWIFAAHESPHLYGMGGNSWTNYTFNWTMTYNKNNTDIHLPYGELRKRAGDKLRDYEAIARGKNKTSLIIVSNCKTSSRRQEFVKELSKYMDIDILGKCGGKPWDCGTHRVHDENCFNILNSYKFYLAFENAFCNQYFSEKFFENFNYDTIMVTRGGLHGDAKRLFPSGSFISTDDFRSAKDLAQYLKGLSVSDYAKLLERKDQFNSIGFKEVYQQALCDVCYRMNFQDEYSKVINDMHEWVLDNKPCLNFNEIKDLT